MPTTPRGLVYPSSTDSPNVPADMQALEFQAQLQGRLLNFAAATASLLSSRFTLEESCGRFHTRAPTERLSGLPPATAIR